MSSAFSSSAEDAITRAIVESKPIDDRDLPTPSSPEFDQYFEIERTATKIVAGDHKRIALQFPDELLHCSVPVYNKLRGAIAEQGGKGVDVYVLADTSYGSCCVDEVAAQHVDADLIVHYGHACISQTYRLPVIFVFGRKAVDVNDCVERLVGAIEHLDNTGRRVVFYHDVSYTHRADEIVGKLRERFKPLGIFVAYSNVSMNLDPLMTECAASTTTSGKSNSEHGATMEDATILYLGGESLRLTNLLMTHASCQVYSYDPRSKTARLESTRTNKLLMRRYVTVQKAHDADVFGILVGTLGVASYLPIIAHIRALISRKHKKSYTISVGKLNPTKLANFMEIECFVLVACPENSVIEAKDFLRPIVTPFELEVALRSEQNWTGQYVLEFEKLLVGSAEENCEENCEEGDADRPVFSLVTGTYRHPKQFSEPRHSEDPGSSAIIIRNQDDSLVTASNSAAGQFLKSRTFQGLEARIGEEAPSILEQGRSGIAREYPDDHKI